MNSTLIVVLACIAIFLVLRGGVFSSFAGDASTEVVDKSSAIGDGDKLSVINRNGGIQIDTWEGGPDVTIH